VSSLGKFWCPHTEDYRGLGNPCPVGCPMRFSRVCPLKKVEVVKK